MSTVAEHLADLGAHLSHLWTMQRMNEIDAPEAAAAGRNEIAILEAEYLDLLDRHPELDVRIDVAEVQL